VAGYKLLISASAAKELESVGTKKERQRIVARIHALAREPRPVGSQKLTRREQYRVRQGPYRIAYEIDDPGSIITIIKIGHRKDVYR
jgi:mRNA interferase RelE/StbE